LATGMCSLSLSEMPTNTDLSYLLWDLIVKITGVNTTDIAYWELAQLNVGQMVSITVSYSGGLVFGSRLGDRLFWLTSFKVAPVSSSRLPWQYPQISPRHLASKSIAVTIHSFISGSKALYWALASSSVS
jgi:hypothetical protein